ncbi:hypothetical protein [Aquabacterium sp.]|uniref:hypothetical protein n=1 Tax=Aquabacterium sp. TaxID=1872578 RepID=UPI002C5C21F0|nr:hypothetical protein [Aquabacterium sp.]HSW06486.1 hypothetical protein [Aquabacterium sp.]
MLKYITAIALCVPPTWSLAQEIPLDEEGFAKLAAQRVQRELPSYDIKPTTRLTLEGKRTDGESTGQLSLDRIYAFCSRNAPNCGTALDQYAKGIGEVIKERDRPIEKSMVRVAVRPAEYVDRIKKQMGSGAAPIYGRPIGAGLSLVPVLDYTRSVRFVGEKDLPKLQVTEDEVFKLGEQNLRASVKPLSEVTPVPGPNAFGSITGEDYASSRIAFHGDWKVLADKLNGHLIVMLPAPDILLYGDGSTPVGVEALRTFGREMAKKSSRPLSAAILRWTRSGWEELK